MRKDHDRGNKGGGWGGRRKTETTNEFLSVNSTIAKSLPKSWFI